MKQYKFVKLKGYKEKFKKKHLILLLSAEAHSTTQPKEKMKSLEEVWCKIYSWSKSVSLLCDK